MHFKNKSSHAITPPSALEYRPMLPHRIAAMARYETASPTQAAEAWKPRSGAPESSSSSTADVASAVGAEAVWLWWSMPVTEGVPVAWVVFTQPEACPRTWPVHRVSSHSEMRLLTMGMVGRGVG